MNKIYFLFLVILQISIIKAELDVKRLRCLVCQATIEELEDSLSKVDPKKTVNVGGYTLDDKGNTRVKKIPQLKSEVFLSDMLDTICNKLDDYVRATWKSNGQLTLIKLMDKNGNMNSDMSRVDIIQDGDLNKSLKYYCEGILEEHEDAIIKHYQKSHDHADIRICTDEAKLCEHTLPEPESNETKHEDEL